MDSGLYYGVEVTPFYDSLLAKLCSWGATRDQAIDRMKRALSEFAIAGVSTTIPFHLQVMDMPEFRQGKLDTGFIERNFSSEQAQPHPEQALAAVLGAAILADTRQRAIAAPGPVGDGVGPAASPWKVAGRRRVMAAHGAEHT